VVRKTKGENVNKKWLVISTAAAVVVAFIAGAAFLRERSTEEVVQAAQTNNDAFVRAHSPVFGNPAAKVTIVEFFDPSCEACRAFYPTVKSIVNASFGQVRLVLRYAALHKGSDTAVKIIEGARQQGKYWEVVEKVLADQPRWADHSNPQPELIWDTIKDLGLDVAKAKSAAASPEVELVLRQDTADMKALKVTATPGFFVNGTPLRDFGAGQLKALVEEEMKKQKAP
jgi:protein-disulfide isomerase